MTPILSRYGLAVAAGVAAMFLAAPAQATPDTDCEDYPSRAVAQAEFNLHGGSPTYNWHGLDADHDGAVCEHHQFPGEPTPPPNPGPGGCAVCPSPSASAEPTPPAPGGPGPGEEPSEPVPTLPVTGRQNAAVAALGGAMLLIGILGIVVSRRRRRV